MANTDNGDLALDHELDSALDRKLDQERATYASAHSITSLLESHDRDKIDTIQLPFLADSIRNDAVYHYERIKDLQSPKNTDIHDSMILLESSEEMEVDRLRNLEIFQHLLLADLKSLLDKIQELEMKLAQRKNQYQITRGIHCGIGLGLVGISANWFTPLIWRSHDYYLNYFHRPEIRRVCTIFAVIGVYTVCSLYATHRYRRSVSCTSRMRKEISGFARRVEENKPLNDRDIECLLGTIWDQVPWKEVETGPMSKLMSTL